MTAGCAGPATSPGLLMTTDSAAAFSVLDWAVLGVYFAGTPAIGAAFAGRAGSADGFTAAGRSLPGWVRGLPGESHAADRNYFAFSLAIPPAAWVAVRGGLRAGGDRGSRLPAGGAGFPVPTAGPAALGGRGDGRDPCARPPFDRSFGRPRSAPVPPP